LAVEIGRETTGPVTSFTSVTGNGLTWVEVAKVGVALNSGSNYNAQLSLYRAMGASPSAGAITINVGFNCVSCAWSLIEFSGIDTSGTNGSGAIVQSVTNTASTVTSITGTLSAFSSAGNATYGAFGASDSGGVPRTFTAGTGYTEIHDTGSTFSAVFTEFRSDNDTTVDATASASTNIGVIAVEIKANTSAVRYIKDYLSGSNVNATNYWVEIQAKDASGTNIASGKTVTASFTPTEGTLSLITDGVSNNSYSYVAGNGTPATVTVDLGTIYQIASITCWHFYDDARVFTGTKTEVSSNGVDWFTIFDSATSGTYTETVSGKTTNAPFGTPAGRTGTLSATLGAVTVSADGTVAAAKTGSAVTTEYGSATSLTITLNSLANGSLATSSAIDIAGASSSVTDVMVELNIASITPSGNKQVVVYAVSSLDGTNFADNTQVDNLMWLGTVTLSAGVASRSESFSVLDAYGSLPPSVKIVVQNDAGVSLAASGNSAQYRFAYDTVAVAVASLSTVTYTVSTAQIPNPERGFYLDLTHTGNWTQSNLTTYYNTDGTNPDNYQRDIRLVHYYCYLNSYKTVPLDSAFFTAFQSNLNAARTRGMKIILRFPYDASSNVDATYTQIQQHCDQLQPYLASNKDIIMMIQCGWVGQWGEYQGSSNFGLDSWPDSLTQANRDARKNVILKTLSVTPVDRFVCVRQPWIKGMISKTPVQDTQRFDGSDISRIGHFDDSFCTDATDRGTFLYPPNSPSASYNAFNEDTFMRQDTLWVPHGGETNGYNATWTNGDAAITFMTKYHTTYLNALYDPAVLDRWANRYTGTTLGGYNTGDGTYRIDVIKRSMGYRLQLVSSTMPSSATAGTQISVTIIVKNVGFAAPCMPRPVKLVLKNTSTSAITTIPMAADPRTWLPGGNITVSENVSIPSGLAAGTYSVHLLLADPDATLATRPEYSIQFANTGLWDATTGRNALNQTITIS
jgi:hypothetical protein